MTTLSYIRNYESALYSLGQWCVETLHHTARFWCEDVAGGMLVIERL